MDSTVYCWRLEGIRRVFPPGPVYETRREEWDIYHINPYQLVQVSSNSVIGRLKF